MSDCDHEFLCAVNVAKFSDKPGNGAALREIRSRNGVGRPPARRAAMKADA